MNKRWHKWNNLGKPAEWFHLHRITVAQNQDGRLEVFAVSTDGALWQIWQTAENNGWSHWESRGKPTVEGIELTSPVVGKAVSVGQNEDGRLLVCVVASREIWFINQTSPNNGWSRWQPLEQPHGSGGIVSLELAQNHDGRLQVFAICYTNLLASRQQRTPNSDWGEWNTDFPRDVIPFKSFAIGQNEDGRLELVAELSGNLALVTQNEPGGSFHSGFGNAGITPSDTIGTLTMARNSDGTLEASTTIDGRLTHIRQHVPNQEPSPGGGGWARQDLGRPAEHVAVRLPVLATNRDGRLEAFVMGGDGNLWHRWQKVPSGDWSNWHSLSSPTNIKEELVFLEVGHNQNGRLEVFIVQRGELWHTWQTE